MDEKAKAYAATPVQVYSTGLFQCHKDPKICAMSWCWPQVVLGLTDFELDRTKKNSICITYAVDCCFPCMCTGCGWFGLGTILVGQAKRQKLRHVYHIEGDSCKDSLTFCFCTCCAIAQDAREVKYRAAQVAASAPQPVIMQPSGIYSAQLQEPMNAPPPASIGGTKPGPAGSSTPPVLEGVSTPLPEESPIKLTGLKE